MLRRIARAFILLGIVFGLMPGGELVLEQVTEVLGHGHLAHTVPGEPDPFAQEHGCSPTEANCACPHAQLITGQAKAEAGAFPADQWLTWVLEADLAGRRPTSARRTAESERSPANRSTAPPTPPANA